MYGISSNERPGQAAASSIIFKKVPWMEDEHIYQFIFYGRCIGYFSQAPDKSKVLSILPPVKLAAKLRECYPNKY
jgi:hypothetical protein